ncbi:SDR family NAD(P)-dependent oxidoreductase [Paenibacillus sp. GCM10027627]|uniref:SDR family NAD(P)-dependent oxidoreductase n=1 Tax=unclassified Paenibacillus TaxID=185978 RepID=UPI00362728D0
MPNNYYMITGTSRGIGEQLAVMLLERGCFVYGIARGQSALLSTYDRYISISFDLSKSQGIEEMLKGIIGQIDFAETEMIALINNAAMVEPLGAIENAKEEEINQSLQISLNAPIALTSSFIKFTEQSAAGIRRKVVSISSGSAKYAAPGMSVYCTAKAGINMFTQCVGLEQAGRPYPVEVIAVDPGMVETDMQLTARGKSGFELAGWFKQAHETGQLQSVQQVAKQLLHIIDLKQQPGELLHVERFAEGDAGLGVF